MIVIILIVLLAVEIINHIKWKMSTTALSYYLTKNGYREPTDKELKDCLSLVCRKMLRK